MTSKTKSQPEAIGAVKKMAGVKSTQYSQRTFVFGSSTPRELSHFVKLTRQSRQDEPHGRMRNGESEHNLSYYMRQARSMTPGITGNRTKGWAFGSSTPREFSHLSRLKVEQRVYDSKRVANDPSKVIISRSAMTLTKKTTREVKPWPPANRAPSKNATKQLSPAAKSKSSRSPKATSTKGGHKAGGDAKSTADKTKASYLTAIAKASPQPTEKMSAHVGEVNVEANTVSDDANNKAGPATKLIETEVKGKDEVVREAPTLEMAKTVAAQAAESWPVETVPSPSERKATEEDYLFNDPNKMQEEQEMMGEPLIQQRITSEQQLPLKNDSEQQEHYVDKVEQLQQEQHQQQIDNQQQQQPQQIYDEQQHSRQQQDQQVTDYQPQHLEEQDGQQIQEQEQVQQECEQQQYAQEEQQEFEQQNEHIDDALQDEQLPPIVFDDSVNLPSRDESKEPSKHEEPHAGMATHDDAVDDGN